MVGRREQKGFRSVVRTAVVVDLRSAEEHYSMKDLGGEEQQNNVRRSLLIEHLNSIGLSMFRGVYLFQGMLACNGTARTSTHGLRQLPRSASPKVMS